MFVTAGAIFLGEGISHFTMIDCEVSDNFAGSNNYGADGGGLYMTGANDHVTLTKTTFSSNWAPDCGGALYVGYTSDFFSMTDCDVSNNEAWNQGGGLYMDVDNDYLC